MFFRGGMFSYISTALVNIMGFLTGVALAWPSPMLPKFSTSSSPLGRSLDSEEESWIGSLSSLGAHFGPFFMAHALNYFGRKPAAILNGLLFLISYAMCAFADNVIVFYTARIIMGIGIGSSFLICPVYIVETVENSSRGFLAATTTTFIMSGILFTYCVGPYVSLMVFNIIISVICMVFMLVFLFFAPETPFFLSAKNKDEKAINSLIYLRRVSRETVQRELDDIKVLQLQEKKGSFKDLWANKATVKALTFCVCLTLLQQLCGITILINYSQNIFAQATGDIPDEVCSIIVGCVQFFTSFTTPLLSDRVGRKRLLIFSTFFSFVAELLLGTYYYFFKNGYYVENVSWLPLFFMILYISFYNFGFGGLPWVLTSELLPPNVISIGSSLVTGLYWILGFVMAKNFQTVVDNAGLDVVFWGFSVFCLICSVFTWFFIFETKGLTRGEIQEKLN